MASSMLFQPSRRSFVLGLVGASASLARPNMPPSPYGVLPSLPQLHWSELGFYNFLHFTVNTFTDKEWGEGDEDPAIFNPTAFDADAICSVLKDAGSKGVILTCKHHDGFCLWPTKTTEHSIRHSPYKNGQGDIVRELSDAAARAGLKFGVYLSPWDRNNAAYGTHAYIDLYRRQLSELLTEYGPIFEIWHDGANGGNGYYGGARETRTIDKVHYYDWPNTWALARQLQPNAVIFSDVGPDIRWVGNEKGIAGETCWATYSPVAADGGTAVPGDVREKESTVGTRNGKLWLPAECDVSIRPGWFWHAAENAKVKTAQQLFDLYCVSTGRGASFLLNVPPDRRGLIHEADAESLRGFGRTMNATFASNLAYDAHVKASNVRAGNKQFHPEHLLDHKSERYWATDDNVTQAEVVFELRRTISFDLVRLREAIALGQRIGGFSVEYWKDDDWSTFGAGTSIGNCRILRSPEPVNSNRVRLKITESAACLALSEFSLFARAR
jgi:alpha-L-fucosidase